MILTNLKGKKYIWSHVEMINETQQTHIDTSLHTILRAEFHSTYVANVFISLDACAVCYSCLSCLILHTFETFWDNY